MAGPSVTINGVPLKCPNCGAVDIKISNGTFSRAGKVADISCLKCGHQEKQADMNGLAS